MLAKKQWDNMMLDHIKQVCYLVWSADVAVMVMQESLACICLATPSMTFT